VSADQVRYITYTDITEDWSRPALLLPETMKYIDRYGQTTWIVKDPHPLVQTQKTEKWYYMYKPPAYLNNDSRYHWKLYRDQGIVSRKT